MGARTRAVLTLPEGDAPLFLRIARAVTDDVRRGRFRAGDGLPGTRALATSLGVNRNTVVAAYRELVAEGWAEARPGGGTFVALAVPDPRARPLTRAARPSAIARAPQYAVTGDAAPLAAPVPEGTLVMAGGLPDVRLVPVNLIARALRGALVSRTASKALAYGDPRGDPALRSAIADLVRDGRGVPAGPDDVVVLRGSQMGLALVARALVPPGEVVAVEAIGYPTAWAAFERAGARIVPVRIDAHGLDVEHLAELVARHRVRAVYVTPQHQYPTTVTLAPGRRTALLELARRERFAIIEDDYDQELHYEGRPVLPLASADVHGSVVYVGTLSKVLAPGLRLGYVIAPAPVLERVARERFLLDRQGDHIGERAAAELLADGTVGRHVRRIRRIYAERRDRLIELFAASFGDRIEVRPPPGGMALWARVKLPPPKILEWERRALEAGVSFMAGERLAFDRRPIPFARFGFAPLDEAETREAVRRLARCFPLVRRSC